MRESMSSKKRIVALLLSVLFLLAVLFSTFFIAENLHHDCTGEDCPICTEMQQAAEFLDTVKILVTAVATAVILSAFAQKVSSCDVFEIVPETLITRKQEMLN